MERRPLVGTAAAGREMLVVPLWIFPTLIGIPAIVLWIRHYQRRFGQAPATGAG